MVTEARPSFAFLVMTFNHQEYILEHLESIKYLVENHGKNWDVDLIINDDCSQDQTRILVDCWLRVNVAMFRHVKTLYNAKNLGTCVSVNNMLSKMRADRCKLTAGDDVYSYENIFELTKCEQDVAMVSGRALHLMGNELSLDWMANILATATQLIYRNNALYHRFKHCSYNNAPNLLYATECLLHPKVRAYLQSFDVVEDWPLQVSIAREFPARRFMLIDKVLVYYRRTPGSTYIVANRRFVRDKLKLYNDLITSEPRLVERLRLSSRRFCFESKNLWINRIVNLDFYYFLFSFIFKSPSIFKHEFNIDLSVDCHKRHYAKIQASSAAFLSKM